jgi:tetratricopeptide (TPR) repeat protein
MSTAVSLPTIGKRYVIQDLLGAGGMGAVYRAHDRLTGQDVALKHVSTPPNLLMFNSRAGSKDLQVALAQEFKILASLGHPNVISVLDYGFDEHRQPFYTMRLLQDADTILAAGQGEPLAVQVEYLLELLQALAYLHRRNILHRDLKPSNVMVADRQVRVLDFGLSVVGVHTTKDMAGVTAGTLAYMAPELLAGHAARVPSDLYAMGLIAYELFAGRYPYNNSSVAALLNDILTKPVDVEGVGIEPDLGAVLEKLLAKDPADRYQDARQVMIDLCQAVGRPLPQETVEIRESFLQAAKFVGREAELGHLQDVMRAAFAGQGSAWLVGGESGVGKSRLLDELRTLALVEGTLVLRGQASSERSEPYELWRDALRHLVLTVELDDAQAGVLKALVPDIGDLLGRAVPDAPPLDPRAAKARLFEAIGQVYRRQPQPVMVILEDLQWSDGISLELATSLGGTAGELPLLILGSYRDDEAPGLPAALPGLRVYKLERLTRDGVAELSVSMLGQAGGWQQLLNLLQRETEGNPFFLVEAVRALALEAGQLSQIEQMAIPDRIFAGGVQEVVQRRLDRVPSGALPLLQLAAVAGRELDLALLGALAPDVRLRTWLTTCAEIAVLDVRRGQWRFAHDKLREGVLDALSAATRPGLHRRVAEVTERLYPDAPESIAYHYDRAGNWEKALVYLERAGDEAAAAYANQDALEHYARALEVCEVIGDSALVTAVRVSQKRAMVNLSISNPPGMVDDFNRMLAAARNLGDRHSEGLALAYRGFAEQQSHDFETALQTLKAALEIAGREYEDVRFSADVQIALVLIVTNRLAKSRPFLKEAEDLAAGVDNLLMHTNWLGLGSSVARWEGRLDDALEFIDRWRDAAAESGSAALIHRYFEGLVRGDKGEYERALNLLKESIALGERIGEVYWSSRYPNIIGWIYGQIQDYEQAMAWNERGVQAAREANFPNPECEFQALANLGENHLALGHLEEADACFQTVEDVVRNPRPQDIFLMWRYSQRLYHSYGELWLRRGDLDRALSYADECLALAEETGSKKNIAKGRRLRGQVFLARGQLAEAEAELLTALDMAQQVGNPPQLWKTWAVLGELRQAQGRTGKAQEAYRQALAVIDRVADSLTDETQRKTFLNSAHIQDIRQKAVSFGAGQCGAP